MSSLGELRARNAIAWESVMSIEIVSGKLCRLFQLTSNCGRELAV